MKECHHESIFSDFENIGKKGGRFLAEALAINTSLVSLNLQSEIIVEYGYVISFIILIHKKTISVLMMQQRFAKLSKSTVL